MQMYIAEFELLLKSINCCYAKDILDDLPRPEDFPSEIFQADTVDIDLLLTSIDKSSNTYLESVSLRLVAIAEFLNARNFSLIPNIRRIWKLILESILIVPSTSIISSIGSQGFLSIPLFKSDKRKDEFDFVRLHIWHDSLLKYIDLETCKRFSVHTHAFYTESWILCGEIINERFKVDITDEQTDYSLFKIGYDKSLNEINQHTSCANNTNICVKLLIRELVCNEGYTFFMEERLH